LDESTENALAYIGTIGVVETGTPNDENGVAAIDFVAKLLL
jgi:hypothetical protein